MANSNSFNESDDNNITQEAEGNGKPVKDSKRPAFASAVPERGHRHRNPLRVLPSVADDRVLLESKWHWIELVDQAECRGPHLLFHF